MGKPAARRLLEAVKKRKAHLWKRNLIHKIIPVSSNSRQSNGNDVTSKTLADSCGPANGLTWLIQEKDVR